MLCGLQKKISRQALLHKVPRSTDLDEGFKGGFVQTRFRDRLLEKGKVLTATCGKRARYYDGAVRRGRQCASNEGGGNLE